MKILVLRKGLASLGFIWADAHFSRWVRILTGNLMEIALFILGVIFGGLVSWGITHAYYKKSSKDQNAIFNKLSEEVRQAILDDNREKLSVLELNELIREKTIDEEVGEAIPYMACPKCG